MLLSQSAVGFNLKYEHISNQKMELDYFIFFYVSLFSSAYLLYCDAIMPDSSSAKNTRQIDRTSLPKQQPWMDTNHFQDQSLSLARHSFQEKTVDHPYKSCIHLQA